MPPWPMSLPIPLPRRRVKGWWAVWERALPCRHRSPRSLVPLQVVVVRTVVLRRLRHRHDDPTAQRPRPRPPRLCACPQSAPMYECLSCPQLVAWFILRLNSRKCKKNWDSDGVVGLSVALHAPPELLELFSFRAFAVRGTPSSFLQTAFFFNVFSFLPSSLFVLAPHIHGLCQPSRPGARR